MTTLYCTLGRYVIRHPGDGKIYVFCIGGEEGHKEWLFSTFPNKHYVTVSGDNWQDLPLEVRKEIQEEVYRYNSTDGVVKWTVEVQEKLDGQGDYSYFPLLPYSYIRKN